MTTFWSLTAIMILLALLFVIPPLWRQRRDAGVERVALNTQVIKDQLEELNADLAAGKLGQDDYAAARNDLERELLDDNTVAEEVSAERAGGGRWMGPVLAVFFPAMAFFIYQQIGTQAIIPRLADGAPAPAPAAAETLADGQSMESVVAKLAQRMQEHPDNLEGWMLLGRSYASMQRFTEALDAYERAWKLAGDNADVLSDYADVMVMANNGQFSARAGELLDKAVAADPAHIKARWLRGHWHFQQADYPAAIADWQRVAEGLPPGNENLLVLNEQIQAARSRMGETGESPPAMTAQAPAPESAAPAAAAPGIEVRVTLDQSLLARAEPDDTLFVFARPVSGARMPLAIVRKQVRDLPLTVTLDDSMAMTPAMVLSKFDQVSVGARVSKSGQAMPSSGDLQGLVTPVNTSSKNAIALEIDEVVP